MSFPTATMAVLQCSPQTPTEICSFNLHFVTTYKQRQFYSALLKRPPKSPSPAKSSLKGQCGKSGEPLLHRERLHIKSRSFLKSDFKNEKSFGVPLFGPNLFIKGIHSQTFL
jgi:hypothetical protein